MKVLKNGRIGKVCKLAALAIVLIGTTQVILQLYSTWLTYRELQSQQGQPAFVQATTFSDYLVPGLNSALQSVASIVFYVVVLYIAGVIINAFFGPSQDETVTNNIDETAITYEPLDNEAMVGNIDKRR